jgi:hypothetical protein
LSTDFLDFKIFAPVDAINLLQQCFGNNEKKLLIISKKSEEDVKLWDLLQKILGAVKHDLKNDTTHLVLHENQQFCLTDLFKQKTIKKIICFGIAPKTAGLNFNITPYKAFEFENRTYLFVHDLQSISEKPALKKQLWNELKRMFLKIP